MNFKAMSIDKLSDLKSQIEATLVSKVADERQSLEAQLQRLSQFTGAQFSRLAGRGVAPKYRNPANPSETWAGRGLRPRWLTAALKSGKKLEHFAISSATKNASLKKSPRKVRKGK